MKAHRTDVVSFAFGLVFLGLALWWLLARILGLAVPPVGWFLAGGLVLIGLLGLVGALRSGRGPDRPDQSDQSGGSDLSSPTEAPETTVAAPYRDGTPADAYRDGTPAGGRAVPEEADEWPTGAVTDVPTPASEDRPADLAPDSSEPATRELPPLDPGDDGPRAGRVG